MLDILLKEVDSFVEDEVIDGKVRKELKMKARNSNTFTPEKTPKTNRSRLN